MSAPLTLRAAKAADLPAIVSLLEDADLPLEGLGAAHLWVAEAEQGNTIGVVGLETHGEAAILRSLAVQYYRRGTGLGRRLTEAALEGARERNIDAVYVLTEDAVDFFVHLGFIRVERSEAAEVVRRSALHDACPDTAALLRLDLA